LVGQDLVALERFEEARDPLEQAIALHEQAKTPAHLIAHARFALAKVRWAAGDRADALELIKAAIDGFASNETTRAEQREAQAWVDEQLLLPSERP
jgi:tetratricopeptide (TPR) repeat protein